jgi:hypothetical protein
MQHGRLPEATQAFEAAPRNSAFATSTPGETVVIAVLRAVAADKLGETARAAN